MTVSPLPPVHLLTIAEYTSLGEDEHGRTELMEGNLVTSPSPTPDHNVAALQLFVQMQPQIPDDLEVILDIDVDLELAPPDQPGTSRRPDLIVVRRTARERVRKDGGLIKASDVLIVVEIVSPGAVRTDRIVKRAEYADAGIPHYWIVDIDPPVSLLSCHRATDGSYRDENPVTTRYVTATPFPVRLELDQIH